MAKQVISTDSQFTVLTTQFPSFNYFFNFTVTGTTVNRAGIEQGSNWLSGSQGRKPAFMQNYTIEIIYDIVKVSA